MDPLICIECGAELEAGVDVFTVRHEEGMARFRIEVQCADCNEITTFYANLIDIYQ